MDNIMKVATILELKKDPAALIAMLQEWGVIARSVRCQKCGRNKRLVPASWVIDRFMWRCKNPKHTNTMNRRVGCYERKTIRKNTFFEKSHLSLASIVHFVRLWCSDTEIGEIMAEVEIAQQTATDWNAYCRKVVTNFCFTGSRPIGGPGKTVEIDVLKFGRRKCNRGRSVEGQWMFGGIEGGSGDFFLCTVEQMDVATLVPLIQLWILPGSTVISDCWRSDGGLQELQPHFTDNCSVNFVDPDTGSHTNMVEGQWRHAKHQLQQLRRVKGYYPEYLAKFVFLNKMQRQNLECML